MSGALLKKLQSSDLFSPDFPKRLRYTHAEWATLPEDALRDMHAAGIAAISRVTNWRELEGAARELGRAKYKPAIPTLAALWADCALVPVRNASGHALRAIGSPEATAALESLIEDHEHLSLFLAVRAVFDTDRTAALDRFAPYFTPERLQQPGGAVVAHEILWTFCPSSFTYKNGAEVPQWHEVWAAQWLASDRRWLELCIRLRHHPELGGVARKALRYADRELVTASLDAAARNEPTRVEARTHAVGDLVSRYLRGDHDEVWRELRAFPAIAGDLREEALAVARETMRRVARAADLLAARLAERGWNALSGTLRTPPAPEDRAIFERIAALTGEPLPVSLQAFWELVGGIDFVWNCGDGDEDEAPPDLGVALDMAEMDPLALDPPAAATWKFEEWEESQHGVPSELADPYDLVLAPDYLHKANISGGPPYGIELPCRCADPLFMNEAHQLPFVDYLRVCFRWGGFPRLERHPDRQDVRAFVTRMCEGIEPF